MAQTGGDERDLCLLAGVRHGVADGVGPAILRNGLRAVGPGPPASDVGSGKMPASRRKMTPVARSDRAARRD